MQLPKGSFSFLSVAQNTTSWLDHIIVSKQIKIANVQILYI